MTALTWDDVEQTEQATRLTERYTDLVKSIVDDPDLDPAERTERLSDAAIGYAERIAEPKAYRPGPIARLFGAKATNADGLGPDDYAVVPDPDKPSTWKLRIDDASHISGAIQALSPAGFRGQKVALEGGERAGALRKISGAIRRLAEADRGNLADRLAALKALGERTRPSQVALYAGKDGGYERFAMWSSNIFEDREGEIFSAEAMQRSVDLFNERPAPKGHVNVWHVGHPAYGWREPGMTDWGEVEHAAYVDGFLLVEGRVTDPVAAKGIADWGHREPLGTSVEYRYISDDLVDGVYHAYEFDRVSVLPRAAAANPWAPGTSVYLGKGDDTMIADPKVRGALVTIYGEDWVADKEAAATAESSKLIADGHAFKSLTMDAPTFTVKFVEDAKDDAAPVATVTEVVVDEPAPPAAPVSDETAAILKQILEGQTAIAARLDQVDAAGKATQRAVDEMFKSPAQGVLGASVQGGNLLTDATAEVVKQDAAVTSFRATGQAPNPVEVGDYGDWGVASMIAAQINGGQAPRGAAGA